MAPGRPAASASATVTRPEPSMACSRARRNSPAGADSVPTGRRAARASRPAGVAAPVGASCR
eukprot:4673711-Pleurochrysis_carterae.AAC.1